MTGMTLTRGARRFISSISSSRRLDTLSVEIHGAGSHAGQDVPMAGRGDEVEQGVNPVVSEARVTLDTRLLG